MLEVHRLQVLVEVADRGSFSAAAAALVCTQPAVSRQIAALERQVGARLLERLPRGVRLTQAGELAVEHARSALARLALAETQLKALADLEGGKLRLGAFASANTSLVPDAIIRFRQHHPNVELSLAGTDTTSNLAAVRAGDLDLALVTAWDLDPPEVAEGIQLLPVFEDELLIALGQGHRLAKRHRIDLRDLAEETWIEGAHPDCLGPLDRFGEAAGFAPRIGFRCDDWHGKQALVAAGVGVMLFPTMALPAVRDDLVLCAPHPALPPRRILAGVPQGSYRAPATAPMIEILRETAHHCRAQLAALKARP
jgi:DNA-binding transcriptional LysR family regulator